MSHRPVWLALLSALVVSSALAAQVTVTLSPSIPSPQPVGTSVMWTASASGLTGPLLYQFSVRPQGATTWNMVRDLSQTTTLPWTMLQEGAYEVSEIGHAAC